MTIPASPLQWPTGWKRTPPAARARARFGKQVMRTSSYTPPGGQPSRYATRGEVTIADGVGRVQAELERMGVSDFDLVISTNLQLRLDGLPRSGQREPDDPGVSVYWRDSRVDGWPMRCMAIDRYDRVADNLAAVAATLEAMRAIERHGGAEILDRAFTGFAALPAPGGTSHWRDLLDPNDPEGSYRRLRAKHHPDRGGDADEFRAVQHAWDAYQQEHAQQ
ncbi:J domain-containing protein [Lysobacter korlensis]|uniref:J domain-containing protein n=1 Tax=Lysobacter korlensis TaxID=553636 RepID=A0ABV6RKG7_9GAMM